MAMIFINNSTKNTQTSLPKSNFLLNNSTLNSNLSNQKAIAIVLGSWCLIKSLISSYKKSSAPEMLQHNDLNTTDSTSMANIFNDYFCDVGKTLAEKILDCSSVNKFNSYLHERVSSCLFLSPTTPTEIFHQINSLKTSKSCGHDEVSSYFLKVAANILAAPLIYFFNTCFTLGIFPDC